MIELSSYFDRCYSEMQTMFGIPHEMFFELNDAFFELATQQIDHLRMALLQKNTQQLILHSHTLKGSSASLRHESISSLAKELEQHAKDGTSFDYPKAIYILSEELAKLRSQYMTWKHTKIDDIH